MPGVGGRLFFFDRFQHVTQIDLQTIGNHQQRAKSEFVFKTLKKGNRGFAQSALFGQFVLADTPVNSFLFEEFNHHVADMSCFVNFHEA